MTLNVSEIVTLFMLKVLWSAFLDGLMNNVEKVAKKNIHPIYDWNG